jgi:sporulation protein YlmC with PRC-barrel domain
MNNQSTHTLDRTRSDSQGRTLERDETDMLIGSNKVEGTQVYATDGEKIGTIDKVMIGKRNGRVEYAVMSFGGFLSMGEKFSPVPWDALDYDTKKGGYVVNIDKNRLKDAPNYDRGNEPSWDSNYGRDVHTYYGVMY